MPNTAPSSPQADAPNKWWILNQSRFVWIEEAPEQPPLTPNPGTWKSIQVRGVATTLAEAQAKVDFLVKNAHATQVSARPTAGQ